MEFTGLDIEEASRRNLMTSLTVLALLADEQARVTEPGCVPCEITSEFDLYLDLYRQHWPRTPEEEAALDAAGDQLRLAVAEPYECFDNAVLLRPAWERLRLRAAEALRVFGWTGLRVHPYEPEGPVCCAGCPPIRTTAPDPRR
jgi:hypothetical protein